MEFILRAAEIVELRSRVFGALSRRSSFEAFLAFAKIAQGAFREAGRFAYHQVSVDLVAPFRLPTLFYVGAQRRHRRTSQLEA